MKVFCPRCGEVVDIPRMGRRPLNIPVTAIYNAIADTKTLTAAAKILGCSRAYIWKALRLDVIK